MTARFSAVVVARNEEALIRRCLESVATIGELVRKWDECADKEARAQLRAGAPPPGPLSMIWAAVSAFRFRFLVAKGHRDGVAGLVLSVLFAFYRFEVEAKRWEAVRYPREGDATVHRLGTLPRLVAALAGHGMRRLWARGSGR